MISNHLTSEADKLTKPLIDHTLDELAELYEQNVGLFDKLVKNKDISKNGLRRVSKFQARIPLKSNEIKFTTIAEQELAQLAITTDQIKFYMALKYENQRMKESETNDSKEN